MSDPAYFQCDCHQPHHAVIVEADDDIPGSFTVSVVATKSGHFWHRVKYALRHVFGGEHLTVGDVILSAENAERLRSVLALPSAQEVKAE